MGCGFTVEGEFVITGKKHSVKSSWGGGESLSIELKSLTANRLKLPWCLCEFCVLLF